MKNLNLNPKELIKQLTKLVNKSKKYLPIASILILLGIYGFLVMRISGSVQQEPSQDDITTQLSTIKRLKIDQTSINKIQQLEDQNIVVQSLFDTARNDPFKE